MESEKSCFPAEIMVATRRNATAENIENSPFNPYGSEIPENMAGKNGKKLFEKSD